MATPEDGASWRRRRDRGFFEAEVYLSIVFGACVDELTRKKRRKPNSHYDRQHALDFVSTWSDTLFQRQFRLPRCKHDELVLSLQKVVRERHVAMAVLSSGSPVGLQTKVLVTLRMLAGAVALDMIWYGIPPNHVDTYVDEILSAMRTCDLLCNIIRVAQTPEEVEEVRAGWQGRQHDSNGVDLFPGLMYAVDGWVARLKNIEQKDVELFGLLSADVFQNYKVGMKAIVGQKCD